MDFTGLIAGLIIIATGFLVKLFPILIAGYNTMSKERKENVDIACLSAFMRNGFIVMGLVIMIGYHLFGWIGLNALVEYWIPAVILLGVGVMVIYARRFNHNKKISVLRKLPTNSIKPFT
jgi:putative Mn2+ efflux pump MntP